MLSICQVVKALRGEESLLLILPKEVGIELNISNQDWLKFEIKNSQLVIKKLEVENNSINTGCE